jgi:uncharacterized CHY-type Zn-finger protein
MVASLSHESDGDVLETKESSGFTLDMEITPNATIALPFPHIYQPNELFLLSFLQCQKIYQCILKHSDSQHHAKTL